MLQPNWTGSRQLHRKALADQNLAFDCSSQTADIDLRGNSKFLDNFLAKSLLLLSRQRLMGRAWMGLNSWPSDGFHLLFLPFPEATRHPYVLLTCASCRKPVIATKKGGVDIRHQ